jgi:hypothetical protein
MHCVYCFESITVPWSNDKNLATLDDFGLALKVPETVSKQQISNAIDFANCHYAFDLIIQIAAFSGRRRLSETEMFNAFEYFGGLQAMTDFVALSVIDTTIMKNVKEGDKSIILSAIIRVSDEIRRLQSFYEVVVPTSSTEQEQEQEQEQNHDEAIVVEVGTRKRRRFEEVQ